MSRFAVIIRRRSAGVGVIPYANTWPPYPLLRLWHDYAFLEGGIERASDPRALRLNNGKAARHSLPIASD